MSLHPPTPNAEATAPYSQTTAPKHRARRLFLLRSPSTDTTSSKNLAASFALRFPAKLSLLTRLDDLHHPDIGISTKLLVEVFLAVQELTLKVGHVVQSLPHKALLCFHFFLELANALKVSGPPFSCVPPHLKSCKLCLERVVLVLHASAQLVHLARVLPRHLVCLILGPRRSLHKPPLAFLPPSVGLPLRSRQVNPKRSALLAPRRQCALKGGHLSMKCRALCIGCSGEG
mmetsp:Transcript_21027/g.43105  ORF Transcript_21027/g.43105 Transcript_21027/m.43105 type:complete len:231 (-) Transcript_21027:1171-1863(-)